MAFLETLTRLVQGALGRGGTPEVRDPVLEARLAAERILQRAEVEGRLKSKKHYPKYSEARAQEVLEMLRNLPAGHLLQGLAFTPQTLSNNPGVVNLIVELRSVTPHLAQDAATYDILLKKLRDVSFLQQEIAPLPQNDRDLRSLEQLGQRIEFRLQQIHNLSLPDIRNADYNADLTNARTAYEANVPPERGGAEIGRPRTPVTPLDFTGRYGSIDPNASVGEKRVYQYLKERIAANPNEFTDTSDSAEEDTNLSRLGHIVYKKKYEVALEEFNRKILDVMRDTAALPERDRLTMENSWQFTQHILKHKRKMQARAAQERGERYQESRTLAMFDIDEVQLRSLLDSVTGQVDEGKKRAVIFEQTFYKILRRVLAKATEQHRDAWGLYEAEAMNELMEMIQEYEGGYKLSSRLTNRMYGIFAAHDAVVIALHPEGNEESWKVLTTFSRNSFTMDMMEDPIVEQLINLYERVLWDVLKTFNGRIPPQFVEPTADGRFAGDSLWDEMVYDRFMQMVDAGVIHDAMRNPDGTVMKDRDGRRVIWDRENPVRRSQFDGEGKWRLNAALQQAKGFGLLSARLLEIFALQRVPAWIPQDMPDWSDKDKVFSSVPYEGMSRFINPLHLFMKWRVADDKFRAYWNIIIGAGEGEKGKVFDINEPQRVFDAIVNGTFEEEFGDKAESFMQKYAYGMFSGRFGPWSTWGVHDAIIGMLDREREYLGGSIRLSFMNKKWATEDVKEFLVERHFKERFLYELISTGKIKLRRMGDVREGDYLLPNGQAVDMEWFEREWRKAGKNEEPLLGIYTADVRREWKELTEHGKPMVHAIEELTQEVNDIYNTFTWVQMATRSPHIVARNTYVMEQYHGKLRKKSLRDKIIEEMFPGLDFEHIFDVGGNITNTHKRWLREQIGVLEGDIDIVAHASLYDEKGPRAIREVREQVNGVWYESDFDKIKAVRQDAQGNWVEDRAETILRQTRAREYFRKSKKAILGTWSEREWMEALGLHYSENGQGKNLILNWDNVWDAHHRHPKKHINAILERAHEAARRDPTSAPYFQLTEELLHKKNPYLLSTEDVVWDKMELINLGYRQWARRGGDFEGHAKGLKAEMKYVTRNLSTSGDMKAIFESFHEMSEAYEEDDKWFSEKKIALHAEATAKFFKQAWWASKTGIFGKLVALGVDSSIAQKVSSRQAGAAWDANKLYEFAHRLGAENLLPWKHADYIGGAELAYSVHQLEEEIGGTKFHALYEAITLGIMMAWVLMMYQALTAKDEEEEGGGGGGHH